MGTKNHLIQNSIQATGLSEITPMQLRVLAEDLVDGFTPGWRTLPEWLPGAAAVSDLAIQHAEQMEHEGVRRAMAFGLFVSDRVSLAAFLPGRRVRVPKGALIKTSRPGREPWRARRVYSVKVYRAYAGHPADKGGFTQPYIVWPGTGGYWNEACLADLLV